MGEVKLTREQEDEIVSRRLEELAISAAYADDEGTEAAIDRVRFAGGWERRRRRATASTSKDETE